MSKLAQYKHKMMDEDYSSFTEKCDTTGEEFDKIIHFETILREWRKEHNSDWCDLFDAQAWHKFIYEK